jgi:hypothetical protein
VLGEGKVRAIKNGRRTLIIARTLDDHFAALPPARIKAHAAPTPAPVEAQVSDIPPSL